LKPLGGLALGIRSDGVVDSTNVSDKGGAMPQIWSRQEHSQAWFAVYTRYHHEKAVAAALTRKGFEIYLPLYDSVQRWKDRNKRVSFPLFPCYLFVHFTLDRKVDIVRTEGVHWIVESSGHAVPIPDDEIASIRRLCSNGNARPHPFLEIGERVRIRRGPLAGAEGLLARNKNSCRVVVSIHLLQKSVAVEVDAQDLEGIGRTVVLGLDRTPSSSEAKHVQV
jgi:transcription antitermination factor NusG